MAPSNRKSRDYIVITVHHPLVVGEIVDDKQHLWTFLMICCLRVFRHAHLKVHLPLQGFAVELVKKTWFIVEVHVLNLLDVLAQRVPTPVQRSASRVEIDTVERASVMPQQQIEHADPLALPRGTAER